MPGRARIEVNRRAMHRIERRLKRYPERIREEVMEVAAQATIAEAQELAPVRTGFLRNSEFVETDEDGTKVIGFGADYGLAVHETHKTQGGFMRRAVIEKFPGIVRRTLQRAVRTVRP